jgi:Domain of unknown function (DUF6438)
MKCGEGCFDSRRRVNSTVMRLISSFWILLIVVGCSNGPAYLLPQQPIPADTLITLERSVCYGTCPDYKLTVSADGTVTFDGREYVKVKGIVRGNIPPEKLRQLIALFDEAKYFFIE